MSEQQTDSSTEATATAPAAPADTPPEIERASRKLNGPTDGRNAVKKALQKSGNMTRLIGGQTEPPQNVSVQPPTPDVAAIQNAENAHEAVRRQDEALRGTSPQDDQPTAPPRPGQSEMQRDEPPGAQREAELDRQQQADQELIPKNVFLQRVAGEVRRRQEAEEKLQTLEAERERERVERQAAPVAPSQPDPEFDGADLPPDAHPLLRQLVDESRQTRVYVKALEGQLQDVHVRDIRRQAIAALGGNEDLFTVVNEVWRDGTAGLQLDEAFAVVRHRYPEAIGGEGDDGREGPGYHTETPQPGSGSPGRQPPATEQDRERELLQSLGAAQNHSARVAHGRDLIRERIGKLNLFGRKIQTQR